MQEFCTGTASTICISVGEQPALIPMAAADKLSDRISWGLHTLLVPQRQAVPDQPASAIHWQLLLVESIAGCSVAGAWC